MARYWLELFCFHFFCVSVIIGRTIFLISDTHLGNLKDTNEKTFNALRNFLSHVAEKRFPCDEFVLNGDFLDVWKVNSHEILLLEDYNGTNFLQYTNLLKDMVENGIEVSYINGNHDDLMTQEYLEKAGLGAVKWYEYSKMGKNYEFHHGHEYTVWDMVPPNKTKEAIKPWSYFCIRAETNAKQNGNGGLKTDEWQYMCDKVLANPRFVEDMEHSEWIWKADLERRMSTLPNFLTFPEYNKYKDVKMRGGHWGSYNSEDVTLAETLEYFKDMVLENVEVYGFEETYNKVKFMMCIDPDYFVKRAKTDLFVLGHTHYFQFVNYDAENRLYVNSGCWLDYCPFFPVVRVTLDDTTGEANFIELLEFNVFTENLEVRYSSPIPIKKE